MNFLFAPFMALLILICALRDVHLPRKLNLLAHPKLVFLGEISLSLYLLHPIILSFMPLHPLLGCMPLQVIFVAFFVIAISIGTYTLIEVPARKFLRSLFSVRGSIHSPVVIDSKITLKATPYEH